MFRRILWFLFVLPFPAGCARPGTSLNIYLSRQTVRLLVEHLIEVA
jgi:hypothetical protein